MSVSVSRVLGTWAAPDILKAVWGHYEDSRFPYCQSLLLKLKKS